jgi:hypothetical protein
MPEKFLSGGRSVIGLVLASTLMGYLTRVACQAAVPYECHLHGANDGCHVVQDAPS